MISPWATNPLVTQGKKYAFRVCFIDPFQGQVGANFAQKNLRAKTAAIMVDVAQDCIIREFDCGTERGITMQAVVEGLKSFGGAL